MENQLPPDSNNQLKPPPNTQEPTPQLTQPDGIVQTSRSSSSQANNFFQPMVNGVPYTRNIPATDSSTSNTKSKKSWHKYVGLGVVLVILAALGVLLATNSSIRGFIFQDKLTNYTFINNDNKYRVLFYRNSTVQNHTLDSNAKLTVITSPLMKQYDEPVLMIIQVTHNVATGIISRATTTSSNCSLELGSTEAFGAYIPSLNTVANFCSDSGLVYYSYFGTNNTEYFVQIQVQLPSKFSSLQAVEESSSASKFLNSRLDVSIIKTIVTSLQPLH